MVKRFNVFAEGGRGNGGGGGAQGENNGAKKPAGGKTGRSTSTKTKGNQS